MRVKVAETVHATEKNLRGKGEIEKGVEDIQPLRESVHGHVLRREHEQHDADGGDDGRDVAPVSGDDRRECDDAVECGDRCERKDDAGDERATAQREARAVRYE